MKYLTHLIALGLGIIIGFGIKSCNVEPCPEIKTGTEVKEVKATKETISPKPVKTYRPAKQSVGTNRITPVPADTIPVEFICNEINVYRDTLIDSAGTVISIDSIQGRLLKKTVNLTGRIVTITNTKEVDRSAGLFIGFEAGINPTGNRYRIAPEVEYLTKKGYAYSYNYDLLNKVHSVGVKKKVF